MELLLAQLSAIARSMWRFRWPAVLVAWVVALVGTAIVFRIPDQYEATARVFVDTQSILKPLMSGLAVQPNIEQQVVMLSRTLVSRPNVEKVVRMADLDLKSESKADQDALVNRLMTRLEIRSVGRDNLYTLGFRDSDPAKAQRVIQSFVSIFVESSLGASRQDSNTAKTFINEQIKIYEARLQQAETRLKEFKVRNIELQMGGEGRDSASRLGELSEQLRQARLDLREAEQSRDAARKQLSGEKSEGSSASAGPSLPDESSIVVATPEIDARIDAQKRNLDALLQRFTDQHPDIVSTRRLIRDLEEQKKKELQELRKAAMASPAGASPSGSLTSQALSQMSATWEVQVAALKARVAEYQSRYNQAREQAKTAPQLEAEAAQLNRDYEINKRNYEDLVKRRESAAMSGELDVAAGVADFRLIDPPRVSPNPVSPNRLLLMAMAMVVALAAGLFTAFAASQLRPVFYSAGELHAKLAYPLLGVVSLIAGDTFVRRERSDLMRFLFAAGSLIGIFVAGLITMSVIASRQG